MAGSLLHTWSSHEAVLASCLVLKAGSVKAPCESRVRLALVTESEAGDGSVTEVPGDGRDVWHMAAELALLFVAF